jgi:predicted transposase YdaD
MLNISEYIDERKDPFFQRGEKLGIQRGEQIGIERGIEKGIEKGIRLGMTEKTLGIVSNLILRSDHDDAFIASIAGLETRVVAQIRELIRQHPDDFKERLKALDIHLA